MKRYLLIIISICVLNNTKSIAQNVGFGTHTPLVKMHVFQASAGNVSPYSPVVVENNSNAYINLLAPSHLESGILFGNAANAAHGGLVYNSFSNFGGFQFRTGGNLSRMVLDYAGNLGIGNSDPAFLLDISDRMRIRSGGDISTYPGVWFNRTDNNFLQAFMGIEDDNYTGFWNPFTGYSFGVHSTNGNVKITSKLGIGTTTPTAPLSFPAAVGKKISFYPGVSGDDGISVAGSLLQIYSQGSGFDIALGYDQGGIFTEKFRFKSTGGLQIGATTGTINYLLTSSGGALPPVYQSLGSLLKKTAQIPVFNNLFAEYVCNSDAEVELGTLSHSITVPVASRLIISASTHFLIVCPGTDCLGTVEFYFKVNGVESVHFQSVPPEEFESSTISNYLYDVPAGTHAINFYFKKGRPGDNTVWANPIAATIIALPL